MRDAKMDKSSINDIVLVGGSTRIPKVQKLLQDLSLDTGFNTISDRRVTSSSETSSSVTESSVNSENLANQLRESPWVTSTTTEENIYTAHNQSSRTNLVKNNNNNNNNNNNMTNTTSNNADMCLFKVSYLLQGG